MKKNIIPLIVITLIFLLVNETYSTTTYTGGDVNGDGVTNLTDARLIAEYIINGSTPPGFTVEVDVADVNDDKKVKMNDAMLIVMGKVSPVEEEPPVEEVLPTKISIDEGSVTNLLNGKNKTLHITYTPSDTTVKDITWSSSNADVATVSQSGKVTYKGPGVVKITATTTNNKKATISIITNKYTVFDSYEGTTLKYYIERPTNDYIITRIWAQDAYNQMKVAITNPMTAPISVESWMNDKERSNVAKVNACYNDSSRTYTMRAPMFATTLLNNEISNKGYTDKAMIAVNASPMVNVSFYTSTVPCSWFGTAAHPIVINNGVVIRDSTNETLTSSVLSNQIYGLTSDNTLKRYLYSDSANSDSANNVSNNYEEYEIDDDAEIEDVDFIDTEDLDELESNGNEVSNNGVEANASLLSTLKQRLQSDGVKYTFGFRYPLIENGTIIEPGRGKSIRQAICQIDANNYILISSTMQESTREARGEHGIGTKLIAIQMKRYGCVNGYSFDGGGSEIYFYKKHKIDSIDTIYDVRDFLGTTNLSLTQGASYDGRHLADMLYFVEK